MVMKMEFGEDAENEESSEGTGLAVRLSKKTKTQAKEKGENGCCNCTFPSVSISIKSCVHR